MSTVAVLLVGAALGAVVGFYVGRLRAEVGRAMHEGRRAMRARSAYRRGS